MSLYLQQFQVTNQLKNKFNGDGVIGNDPLSQNIPY